MGGGTGREKIRSVLPRGEKKLNKSIIKKKEKKNL